MNKLIFSLLFFIAVTSQAQAIQVIYRSNSNRDAQATHELNQREEQQELLRKQVRMQEEQLRIQQQMLREQQQQNRYR